MRIILAGAFVLGFGGWLIHMASQQKEAIHARNVRWLAHTANKIRDKVQTYDRMVKRAADDLRSTDGFTFGIAEKLEGIRSESECAAIRNFAVVPPMVQFTHKNPTKKIQCAQTDLGEIVRGSLRSGVFSTVIVAKQDDGAVLYQSGNGVLRRTNIFDLFQPADAAGLIDRLRGARPADAKAETKSAPKADTKPDGPQADKDKSAALSRQRTHFPRTMDDQELEVYVEPFTIAPTSGSEGPSAEWVLIGTINRRSLVSTTSSNNLFLVLPLIVLLLLVSWPLPKPWLLGPCKPLRRYDMGHVVACTFAVVLILNLMGLHHYVWMSSSVRTNRQLNKMAQLIGDNLTHEVRLGLEQLTILNGRAESNPPAKSTEKFLECTGCIDPNQIRTRFEYVDWVTRPGDKVIRWTPRSDDGVKVNVKDRHYFQNALKGDLLTLAVPEGGKTIDFSIEQVLSRTTGKILTMLAIRSNVEYTPPKKKPETLPVASIGLMLASVRQPAMPDGFGFAIVDQQGRAIFHSDESRVMAENLLEECPESPELIEILTRRTPAELDTNYGGVPHRFLISPIRGLEMVPWSLVAFRDLEAIQQLRGQGLVDTAMLVATAALVEALLLLPLFWFLRSPRFTRRNSRTKLESLCDLAWWTRPLSSYPYLACAGLLFTVILLRAIHTIQGPVLFYCAIGAALGFLGLSGWCLRYRGGLTLRAAPGLVGAPVLLLLFSTAYGDWVMAVSAPLLLAAAGWILARPGITERWKHTIHQAAWLIWTAEYVFCLCVAPTIFLSKFAFEYETSLTVRDMQWQLWHDADQRAGQLWREINEFVMPEKTSTAEKGDPEAQTRSDVLKRELMSSIGLPGPATRFSYEQVAETELQWRTFGSKADSVVTADAGPAQRPSPFQIALDMPILLLAHSEIAARGTGVAFDVRHGQMQPAHKRWSWRTSGNPPKTQFSPREGNIFSVESRLPIFHPLQPWLSDVKSDKKSGSAPEPDAMSESVAQWETPFGILAILGLVMFWAHKLRAQVLQLQPGFSKSGMLFAAASLTNLPHRWILTTAGSTRVDSPEALEEFTVIDFASDDSSRYSNAHRLPSGGLWFRHLESRFWDETVRLPRLALLEEALISPGRTIVVVSAIDPSRYLRTQGISEKDSKPPTPELQRWRRVLNYFSFEAASGPQTTISVNPAEAWEACSEQEQLVLAQLEKHKLVNPATSEALSALWGRGLVRRAKSQRWVISNAAFRRYVHFGQFPTVVKEAEELASKKKLPLLMILLVLAGVVLFLTQEEVTLRMVGVVTSVSSAIEALRRQLGAVGALPRKD